MINLKKSDLFCEFVIEKKETNNGVPFFLGEFRMVIQDLVLSRWAANSGGWGKGPLEVGEYEMLALRRLPYDQSGKPFMKDGFPWVLGLRPLFKTLRTDLAIHPDGNIPGTLGCVGIVKGDISCFYMLQATTPGKLIVR